MLFMVGFFSFSSTSPKIFSRLSPVSVWLWHYQWSGFYLGHCRHSCLPNKIYSFWNLNDGAHNHKDCLHSVIHRIRGKIECTMYVILLCDYKQRKHPTKEIHKIHKLSQKNESRYVSTWISYCGDLIFSRHRLFFHDVTFTQVVTWPQALPPRSTQHSFLFVLHFVLIIISGISFP